MPPVDVPAIRSKYETIRSSLSSSSDARNAAGKTPLSPPPSIVRTRRTCVNEGSLAAIVVDAFSAPVASGQPDLIEEEPEEQPRHDCEREPTMGAPFASARVIKTWTDSTDCVDMRNW